MLSIQNAMNIGSKYIYRAHWAFGLGGGGVEEEREGKEGTVVMPKFNAELLIKTSRNEPFEN
jgi:hypothetical protein